MRLEWRGKGEVCSDCECEFEGGKGHGIWRRSWYVD